MPADPPAFDPEVEPLIEESITIDAPLERVWPLVSDPRLMSRWSGQVWRVFQRSGVGSGVGSRFLNINRSGWLVWPTQSQVVTCQEPEHFAWRIRDNRTVWSFSLAPSAPASTMLVLRRECPEGVSDRSLALERRFMGGVPQFQATLREGMRATLVAIKRYAEGC